MTKKEKIEIILRVYEATAKSPSLGNIPGNIDEQIKYHKQYANAILLDIKGKLDAIKE